VAIALVQLEQLRANELPASLRASQQRLDLLEPLLLLGPLLEDLADLEPGELVEADFEDRVGLHLVELEGAHQLRGGVLPRFGLPDDADGAIEVVVYLGECIEDVQPLLELALLVLEPPCDDLHAEIEEMAAELPERHARRLANSGIGGRH